MQLRKIGARSLPSFVGVLLLATGAVSALGVAHAQTPEPLRNVVQLSASGQVEVDQDWLQMNLSVNREGTNAAAVQKQLQQSVDAAMRSLKPQAQG